MERLILDTTVLVAAERERLPLDDVIGDEDDIAVAAVTAAELLVGVELADRRRRANRATFVESLLAVVPVEVYDLEVARAHAVLLAYAYRSGQPRGAHDLLIAATARSRQRVVVTADPAGFEGLPDVSVRIAARAVRMGRSKHTD
ncbi:MAG: type II toxin-antitoxin system VapC family toxin [Actinobacteria bacterium]|nr:MAG: type II toxin-antitoxin system VapC family toxin [Actinomycetota bacterium]